MNHISRFYSFVVTAARPAFLVLLAVFAPTGFASSSASAHSLSTGLANSDEVLLLSYSQLMQLPTESREKYIADVRVLLIDLAKRPDGRFSDQGSASRSKLKAWLDLLEREIPDAQAQAPGDPITTRRSASQSMGSFLTKSAIDRDRFNCRSVERVEIFSPSASAALPPCSAEAESKIRAAFEAQRPIYFDPPANAPERKSATQPELKLEIKPGAVPERTTEKPEEQRVLPQLELRTRDSSSRTIAPIALRRPSQPSPGTLPVKDQISRRYKPEEMTEYLQRRENPNQLCIAEAQRLGVGPMDLVSIDGTRDRFCMTKEAEDLYRAGQLVLPDDQPQASTGALPDSPSQAESPKQKSDKNSDRNTEKNYSCRPKPDICEAPTSRRDQIITGNIPCVFAGMLSQFDSRNRRCQPQTEFSVGDKKYTCASGQTMCNPLLFGTQNSTTAICIGRSQNATQLCSKLSSSRDAEKFLNRNETGLQEKWNDFRKGFAETCKPGSPQAKFHCQECSIMKIRLFDLHARLLKDPCSGDASGSAEVDARIKQRSGGTSR